VWIDGYLQVSVPSSVVPRSVVTPKCRYHEASVKDENGINLIILLNHSSQYSNFHVIPYCQLIMNELYLSIQQYTMNLLLLLWITWELLYWLLFDWVKSLNLFNFHPSHISCLVPSIHGCGGCGGFHALKRSKKVEMGSGDRLFQKAGIFREFFI